MNIAKLAMVLSLTLISIVSYCPSAVKDPVNRPALDEKLKISKEVYLVAYTLRELEGGHKYFKNGKPLPGASGEQGVYQFMPSTWRNLCRKFFGEILDKTKDNQDLVAYRYLETLLAKYSLRQIASIWNSGKPNSTAEGINKWGVPYSVPKYIKKFMATYNKVKKEISFGNLEPIFVANVQKGLYIYIKYAKINNIKTTTMNNDQLIVTILNETNQIKWELTINPVKIRKCTFYHVSEKNLDKSLFRNPLAIGNSPGRALNKFLAIEQELLNSLG